MVISFLVCGVAPRQCVGLVVFPFSSCGCPHRFTFLAVVVGPATGCPHNRVARSPFGARPAYPPSSMFREFDRKRWGDEGYAQEELVAELDAAFLSADLGITAKIRDDHSAYIASWLKVLKEDKRAIFTAAAHAQGAVDFLQGLQASDKEAAQLPFIENGYFGYRYTNEALTMACNALR